MGPEEDKIIREAEEAAIEDEEMTPLDYIEEFDLAPEEIYDDAY